ncbi:hypothetical protein LINPERHAP2_LOCUS35775 [Linum perenne]
MIAELRAAEIGLSMAWDLDAKKVVFQLDFLSAFLALAGQPVEDSRHGPIINQILQLRN